MLIKVGVYMVRLAGSTGVGPRATCSRERLLVAEARRLTLLPDHIHEDKSGILHMSLVMARWIFYPLSCRGFMPGGGVVLSAPLQRPAASRHRAKKYAKMPSVATTSARKRTCG